MRRADLRAHVPRLAAAWLATTPEARHHTFDGSMAFVDISGFTALTERLARQGLVGSEELSDILDATFTAVLAHAHEQGGDLIKWGGDAVLLLFQGAQHAPRAVQAAVAMRTELRAVGRTTSSAGKVTLRMSVGIHSGPFHLFLVGDPSVHRELIVSGPTASRTAEMEGRARASQVLVSCETAALLHPACLGVAVGDGRLIRSAPRTTAAPTEDPGPEVDVSNLLPPPVRSHLLAAAGESEHRSVAVAFVQFSGTDTLLREHGPQALAEALDYVVRNVQDACARNEVTFLESDINRDGGKLMLVAGAPDGGRDVEDRILRTVRLAVDRAGELPLRAGINRGGVFGGDFGPDNRRTYSIKGDAINLAARVMGKASPGEVLATREVVLRAHGAVSGAAVEPFMVKGKSRPVHAVLIEHVSEDTGAHPDPSSGRRASTRIVGRQAELDVAEAVVSATLTGPGEVLEVVGAAGLGKSALARRICERAPTHRVLHAPSGRFGGASAFNAVRRLLRDVSGTDGGTPREGQLEALHRCVVEQCPHLLAWFPLLAAVLDVPVPDTEETRELNERFRAVKVVEVVTDFLRAVAETPTVFVLEDADEMDASSAAIMTELADELQHRPWVLLTTRTNRTGGFAPTADDVTRLELDPFGTEESVALLESWSQDQPVSPHLLRAVAAKAGGNPLFLEALFGAVRQHRSVADLPDSVEEVVTGQIDRLAPRDRTVLRFAAVLGEQFSFDALRTMVREEGWTVDLEDLQRLDQFVRVAGPGPGWWSFTSGVVRDAAYQGLPFRLRRRMHLRVGAVLEATAGDDAKVAERLSTHFFEGGDHQRAWTYARRAADRARGLYSYAAAIELYERAIASAEKVEGVERRDVASALESLGDVADLAGLSQRGIAAYRKARKWAREDPVLLATLMSKEAAIHQRVGSLTTALRIVAHARGLVAGSAPEACAVRSRLSARVSFAHYVHSRHREALRWSAIAVDEARAGGDPAALAYAYNLRDLTLTAAGESGEERFGELALASYELSGDLEMQAKCLNNLGIRAFQEGQWLLAATRYADAAGRFRRVGDTANEANSRYNLADLHIRQGRVDDAEVLLNEALHLARVADDVELIALIARETGKMRLGQGRLAEARDSLLSAREGLGAAGLGQELLYVSAGLARCLALEGDLPGAVDAIDEVLLEAERNGGAAALAWLHYVRGDLLLRQGRWDDAERAFCAGFEAPDSGDGGCFRGLNRLGLARAGARGDAARATGAAEAEAALVRLGVVIPPWP
jgi:class 3 adenylate cyclase/tetratricopeptide (TPR) repeat protein